MTDEQKKARRDARREARRAARRMPDSIKNNRFLDEAMSKALPSNYNFEIKKTLWRIEKNKAKIVALQFPEGLLMYSCIISDIIQKFSRVEDVLIMGDVTYGACCVDDYSAVALGCDMLVHYGHSCLVPVNKTSIPVQYVFVDIDIDVSHLIECIKLTIPERNTNIAIWELYSLQQLSTQLSTCYSVLVMPVYKFHKQNHYPEEKCWVVHLLR